MSKCKANNKTAINLVTKQKCSLMFNPGWLIETVETELPIWIWSRKQLTKLGDNTTLIVKVVTTLFARCAKNLVQAGHSLMASDGTIG